MTDFTLFDHGSILVLTANTEAAEEWENDHLPEDRMTWAGGTVIEPRYVEDIVLGLQADGLTVEGIR